METTTEEAMYLTCERKNIFLLLILCGGMMGAYTFNMRGGVFCNAQTANFVLMSISFGQGHWAKAFYYLLPMTAYLLGSMISEALPSPIKQVGPLRWDTFLVLFEAISLFCIGFVPLTVPHQIVQVIINFLASMQYNTFRQAEGIPMATTFCTNHVRQVGITLAKMLRKRDRAAFKRGMAHLSMLLCFVAGGTILTVACPLLQEKAIWLALIPLGIILVQLIRADLLVERDLMEQKPHGH